MKATARQMIPPTLSESGKLVDAFGCLWATRVAKLLKNAPVDSCESPRRYSALPLRRDFLETLHQLKSGPRSFKNVPRYGVEVRMQDLCRLIQITSLIPMSTHEPPLDTNGPSDHFAAHA